VNSQLIDAESAAHLWADRFDADRANLPDAQREITGRLARTLNLQLVEASARQIEQENAANPDARDLVMRGWALYSRPYTRANLEDAQKAFERALVIDPGSVDARIGVAQILVGNLVDGWTNSFQQDKARAEQLLLEALERDPNRSSAHFAMGVLRRLENRLGEAQREYETAIALDSNNARAFLHLGHTLNFLGQPEAAIPQIDKAIRLNPHDPNMTALYSALGMSHLFLGHVDQAIDLLRRACAANPRLYYPHLYLAGALGFRGDLDEARTELAEAIKIKPEINSLARWRALVPSITNPQHWALLEKTFNLGLRRIGFPEN
jgi:tetratricopeptide (TPR) repeat protein